LLHPSELDKVRILRRVLSDMHPTEAMEMLTSRQRKTRTNAEFLISMNMS
jgi:transcription termination factor Rho